MNQNQVLNQMQSQMLNIMYSSEAVFSLLLAHILHGC